jgi:iron complex outermembrane receptor protein
VAGHALLHRVGALLHATKEIMFYAMESTTYSVNTGILYSGVPLPNVQAKDDEVGFKTDFLDGRLSSTFSAYKLSQTNQSILGTAPPLNPQGLNYYIPIGTTTSHGWDGDISYMMAAGWQIMATGYVGTVRDQNNNPVGATYGNMWSVITRYDFQPGTALKGFGLGTGMNRRGNRYLSESGETLPGNAPLPNNTSGTHLFKLHEGTDWTIFGTYNFLRHWQVRVSLENVLNIAYPDGAQGVGLVDPNDPRTFTCTGVYKF